MGPAVFAAEMIVTLGAAKNKKSCYIAALYLYHYAKENSFCLCREQQPFANEPGLCENDRRAFGESF